MPTKVLHVVLEKPVWRTATAHSIYTKSMALHRGKLQYVA